MATILWIEGKRSNNPSFIPGLRKKGYTIETVLTGAQALEMLPSVKPDVVIINTASMRGNGKRICSSLRNQDDTLSILVIADLEKDYPDDIPANVVITLPFTIRKLNNRIIRILPGEGDKVIKAGPILLDLNRKVVRCHDNDTRLTPRLVKLLKTLMEQPGEVLRRKQLFIDIWETDYVGDTRTLDVHISWLRKAIEEDPRNPQLLKTIRGVGYRLDI